MRVLRQRLHRLEAQRIAELLAVLDAECARFAAFYGAERYREPFDQMLAPFSDTQLEVFCAALEVQHGGGYQRLNVEDLTALVDAFRRHNVGQRL